MRKVREMTVRSLIDTEIESYSCFRTCLKEREVMKFC